MSLARSQKRRLIDEICEVGSNHARRRASDLIDVDIVGKRNRARVHRKDQLTATAVRRLYGHAPIETSRPEECLVEDVGTVC